MQDCRIRRLQAALFLRSDTLIWLVGMLLLCAVPFLSSFRTGPQSGFFIEAWSLFFAVLLFACFVARTGRRVLLPRAACFFLIAAAALVVQARIMDLPYNSQSDLTAAVFVGMALLAWAVRFAVARIGRERVVLLFCYALLTGIFLQSIVCVLQFTGTAKLIPGVLTGPGNHYVFGQLGQRNHLGHYLMWGVPVLAYLWSARRLPVVLAVVLMLWLTGVMGLVGSRTILAYVAVLAVAAVCWRLWVGKAANRFMLRLLIGVALVLLFQLALSPLLAYIFHADFQSAAQRLGDGNFSGSGRSAEWKKAILSFLQSPWWGHGWGSYAEQGIRYDSVYPHGFREYENKVLFTNCHNLILQLLAETGIVGFLAVSGGFLWATVSFFRRPFDAVSGLMVCLILVSLTHSMLEYPLWYVYFLTVFVIAMSLVPESEREVQTTAAPVSGRFRATACGLTVVFLAGIVWQGSMYAGLVEAGRKTGAEVRAEQGKSLLALRSRAYFLRYYFDMKLLEKSDIRSAGYPEWGRRAAELAGAYRPYSNTYIRAGYLMQAGKKGEAEKWLTDMAHYYPVYIPDYTAKLGSRTESAALVPLLDKTCRQYEKQTGKNGGCRPVW